jgi:hypothetical protein
MHQTAPWRALAAFIVVAGVASSAPAADSLSGATPITSLPYTEHIDLGTATRGEDDPQPYHELIDASVWYRYSSAAGERLRASTEGSDVPTPVVVFRVDADDPSMLAEIAQNQLDQLYVDLDTEAGGTYLFMVANVIGSPPAGAVFTLSLAPVPGDDFSSAILIPEIPYDAVADMRTFTLADDDPFREYEAFDATLWYRYTAVRRERLVVSTAGSASPTPFAVFVGARRGEWGEQIAGSGDDMSASFDVVAGQTYDIYVVNLVEFPPGPVKLTVTAAAIVVEGDERDDAIHVTGIPFQKQLDTRHYTVSDTDPYHDYLGASVWFLYHAPYTETLRVSTTSSEHTSPVLVFRADDVGEDRELSADVSFALEFEAGTTYLFLLVRPSDVADGVAVLSIEREPPMVVEGTVSWGGAGLPFTVRSARLRYVLPSGVSSSTDLTILQDGESTRYRIEVPGSEPMTLSYLGLEVFSCDRGEECVGVFLTDPGSWFPPPVPLVDRPETAFNMPFMDAQFNEIVPTLEPGRTVVFDWTVPPIPFVEVCAEATLGGQVVPSGSVLVSPFHNEIAGYRTLVPIEDGAYCAWSIDRGYTAARYRLDGICDQPYTGDLLIDFSAWPSGPRGADIHIELEDGSMADTGTLVVDMGMSGRPGGLLGLEMFQPDAPFDVFACRGPRHAVFIRQDYAGDLFSESFEVASGPWIARLTHVYPSDTGANVHLLPEVRLDLGVGQAMKLDFATVPARLSGRLQHDYTPTQPEALGQQGGYFLAAAYAAAPGEPPRMAEGLEFPHGISLIAGDAHAQPESYELGLTPGRDHLLAYIGAPRTAWLTETDRLMQSSAVAPIVVAELAWLAEGEEARFDFGGTFETAEVNITDRSVSAGSLAAWTFCGTDLRRSSGALAWTGLGMTVDLDAAPTVRAHLPPGYYADPPPIPTGRLSPTVAETLTQLVAEHCAPIFEPLQPLEVDVGDRLTADMNAPGITSISPDAGPSCTPSVVVTGLVTDLPERGAAAVAVNGSPVTIGADGRFARSILVPIGAHPFEISAVGGTGHAMKQHRTLTRPLTVDPAIGNRAGFLVSEGSASVAPRHLTAPGATVPLKTKLTSCGLTVTPADVLEPVRLISVRGSDGGVQPRSDMFAFNAEGEWQLDFKAPSLPGVYTLTFAMPDGTRWTSVVEVKP